MKKITKTAVCAAACMACSCPALAAPSETGALRVEGSRLVGSNGEVAVLRGISTHGLAWFPEYVNEKCFEQLRREWNVDVIRLAMYTAESGGYCTDGDQEALKQLIYDGVEYASAQDMYVIIDWHILSDYDPNLHLEEAKEFFDGMSKRYAGADNVLYEICNEPNGGIAWQDIKTYAEEIIETIRSNDKDGIILVGTPNWSQFVDQAAADPIEGYENIMYTLHFYAATHQEDLRGKMTAASGAGLPIFVSEYGICDASGSGAIDEAQADKWIEAMDECGISYVAWNLSNKDETSAILKSTCTKIGGFTEDDLSASGQWLYRMLAEKAAEDTHGSSDAAEESARNGNPAKGEERKNDEESGSTEEKNDPGSEEIGGTDLTLHLSLVNSWESEGKMTYQYNLTLENTSDVDCTEWAADIPFRSEFELMDGWNGDYTVQGQTLHISSKDYNGNIPSGGSAVDIGFIVRGGDGILE